MKRQLMIVAAGLAVLAANVATATPANHDEQLMWRTLVSWDFEGEGTQVADGGPEQRDGVLWAAGATGLPQREDGPDKKALRLTSAKSGVRITTAWPLARAAQFEFEALVKFNSPLKPAAVMQILGGFGVRIVGGGRLQIFMTTRDEQGTSHYPTATSAAGLEQDRWYRVKAGYDGASLFMEVDGERSVQRGELIGKPLLPNAAERVLAYLGGSPSHSAIDCTFDAVRLRAAYDSRAEFQCARDWAESLAIGLDVLEQNQLPMDSERAGGFLMAVLRQIQAKCKRLRKESTVTADDVRSLLTSISALERRMIMESFNILARPIQTPEAVYAWRIRQKNGKAIWRRTFAKLLEVVDNNVLDWHDNQEALQRHGLTVEPSIEIARVNHFYPTLTGDETEVDRFFSQAYAFYKAVMTERFRVAAAVLAAERELRGLGRAVALRREMGAEAEGFEPLKQELQAEIKAWRRYLGYKSGYAAARKTEARAGAIMARIKAVAYAPEQDIPVVRPGASFTSSGRLAKGGSWTGLLNYEIAGPVLTRRSMHSGYEPHFQPYAGKKLTWQVGCEVPESVVDTYDIKAGSWTYQHLEYDLKDIVTKAVTKQEVWWSMLAPGTLYDTHGPRVVLADLTTGVATTPDKVIAILNGRPTIVAKGEAIDPAAMTEAWILALWENNAPQVPVLVYFKHRPTRFEWTDKGLVVERNGEVGRYVLALPYGAHPKPARWSESFKTAPKELVRQCRDVVKHLAFYPLHTEECFAVDQDRVTVWNRLTDSIRIDDDWNTPAKPYLPVPPMYALGIEGGVPITFGRPLSKSLLATKYGFFKTVDGEAVSYTMPRVPMRNRHPLKPSGEDERVKAYNERLRISGKNSFKHLHGQGPGNWVEGWCLMDEKTRDGMHVYRNERELEILFRNATDYPTLGGSELTKILIDPATGIHLWASSASYTQRRALRNLNDLSSHWSNVPKGALLYGKLFGKWDLIEKNWEVLKRAHSVVPARLMWAVPTTDVGLSGFISYTDMLGDTFRNNSLMHSLARIMGDEEKVAFTEYVGTRTMMSIGCQLHPNTPTYCNHVINNPVWQSDTPRVKPGSDITKLHHASKADMNTTPFQMLGVKMFDYPLFDGMLTFFPRTAKQWIDDFCADVPEWSDPKGPYRVQPWSKRSNSSQTVWNILKFIAYTTKDREALRELYDTKFHPEDPAKRGFFYDWWLFGNAMPHIIAQNDPIWLSLWGKAVVDVGTYDRETQTATIVLNAPEPGELALVSWLKPKTIERDGVALSKGQWAYDQRTHDVTIPFGYGRHEIRVVLPRHDPANINFPDFKAQPMGRNIKLAMAAAPGAYAAKQKGDIRVGKCESIDLRPFCNMGFADPVAGDGKGGTHDSGESWLFPKGEVVLRGVPFTVIDPEKNADKSCIVFKSRTSSVFPREVTGIPVNQTFRRLFFFHGTGATKNDGATALTYVIHFEDGQQRLVQCRTNVDIGWFKAPRYREKPYLEDLPNACAVPLFPEDDRYPRPYGEQYGASGFVFVWEVDAFSNQDVSIDNTQRGVAKIKSIDIISAEAYETPMVFAITGEL